MKQINLTKHVRHARLVKIVRAEYQRLNPGSRLFNNTSGTAWQGYAQNGVSEVVLKNPRPVKFGIPSTDDGSGGADLLGWTMMESHIFPIFTAIECKSGNGKLQKNQKNFRAHIKSVNGIYHIARECPECWEHWEPIYIKGKLVKWIPVKDCPTCGGLGYRLEE